MLKLISHSDARVVCRWPLPWLCASMIYLFWQDTTPPFVVIHRMVSAASTAFRCWPCRFFILAGNLMNNAGITNRIYNYALALGGLAERRPGPCECGGFGGFCGHERHGHCRCSRAWAPSKSRP